MKKAKASGVAVAVITIRRSQDMTPKGRKDVAAWIRRNAGWLEKHWKDLGPTFRATYWAGKP